MSGRLALAEATMHRHAGELARLLQSYRDEGVLDLPREIASYLARWEVSAAECAGARVQALRELDDGLVAGQLEEST